MTLSARDLAALRDIDDALSRAARIVARGRATFDEDEAVRLACEALAARVGEIARGRLTDGYREGRPDIPWSEIVRMRDLLVHQYHRIDHDIVWTTVSQEMPQLREQLAEDLETARTNRGALTHGEADGAPQARGPQHHTRRDGASGHGPSRWVPDTARCGSTETVDGHPCRNPVSSPGQRCRVHR